MTLVFGHPSVSGQELPVRDTDANVRFSVAAAQADFRLLNRFVRWRRAGVWGRIIDALAAAHDADVQMIDTSIVRVHQHEACIIRNRRQSMGGSRGGLTSKIHAVVDSHGLPVRR